MPVRSPVKNFPLFGGLSDIRPATDVRHSIEKSVDYRSAGGGKRKAAAVPLGFEVGGFSALPCAPVRREPVFYGPTRSGFFEQFCGDSLPGKKKAEADFCNGICRSGR